MTASILPGMKIQHIALALLIALPAYAQQKPAAPSNDNASGGATAPRPSFRQDASATQALFERLDKNRDGYLTGGELTSQEAQTTNWLAVDRDGDGRISRAEFGLVAAPAPKPQPDAAAGGSKPPKKE
jgi:hypothetical protein